MCTCIETVILTNNCKLMAVFTDKDNGTKDRTLQYTTRINLTIIVLTFKAAEGHLLLTASLFCSERAVGHLSCIESLALHGGWM